MSLPGVSRQRAANSSNGLFEGNSALGPVTASPAGHERIRLLDLKERWERSWGAAGMTPAKEEDVCSHVKVVVRVRPESQKEKQGSFSRVVRVIDQHVLVFDPKEEEEVTHRRSFNRIAPLHMRT